MPDNRYFNSSGLTQSINANNGTSYTYWFSDAAHTTPLLVSGGVPPVSGSTVYWDQGTATTGVGSPTWNNVTIAPGQTIHITGNAAKSLTLNAACTIGAGSSFVDNTGVLRMFFAANWLGNVSIIGASSAALQSGWRVNGGAAGGSISITNLPSTSALGIVIADADLSQVQVFQDITIQSGGPVVIDFSQAEPFGLRGHMTYTTTSFFIPANPDPWITLLNSTADAQGVNAAPSTDPGAANVKNGVTYEIFGVTITGTMPDSHGCIFGD
jgi:hypothetical protein